VDASNTAKPATACAANGLRNSEQLGGRLDDQDTNSRNENQTTRYETVSQLADLKEFQGIPAPSPEPFFIAGFQSCIKTIDGAARGKEALVFAKQAPLAIYYWKKAGRDKVDGVDRVNQAGTAIGLDVDYVQECLSYAVEATEAAPNSIPQEYKKPSQVNGHDGAPDIGHDGSTATTPPPKEKEEPKTWPKLDDAALQGVAGDIVRKLAPHTEGDPVAILIQTLAMVGNVIGRNAWYQVEADRHHPNLFAVLAGASSKSRKGTSAGRVEEIVKFADERSDERKQGGLSSGEGLIHAVRDKVKKWDAKEQTDSVVDPGITDKRLMVVEPEFASVLNCGARHGNTLSQLIRQAWDGGKLSTLTRTSSLTATGAHISIVGHVTVDELRATLTRTDAANGFANRFLFALVKRSKELPFGGDLSDEDVRDLGAKLKEAVSNAPAGRVTMTESAKKKWQEVYSALSKDRPGLLGAVTARAEAQAARLAMIYALLAGQKQIDLEHLLAGLAVWQYCEASAAHIFGDKLGDPLADEIRLALRQAGAVGKTRTEIRNLFHRHESEDRIAASLELLRTHGRARAEAKATGGRPAETWFAVLKA
jgi:hypothetical protein